MEYLVVQVGFRKGDNSPYAKGRPIVRYKDGGAKVREDGDFFFDGQYDIGDIVVLEVSAL